MNAYLDNNPLCCRCGAEPHMKGNSYCKTCLRIVNGLPIERERPNVDRNNKTMCCRCKVKPRRKGGHYCIECSNAMNRAWNKENWKEYLGRGNNRQKHNARSYVHYMVSIGKLTKTGCSVCGALKVEAHHHKGYDYEHRLDVIWLCKKHHLEAERLLKKQFDSCGAV